jgi:hypothetical protein
MSDQTNQNLAFKLSWFGPDGQSFYSKNFMIDPGEKTPLISSSISIPPEKREPGTYCIQLELFGEIISRKSFALVNPD